ncbi:MAG: calcium-binding protein [Sulfuricurvum sp.]|nr:calcium-binding protein [Sulfuricurvum sp.]MDD5387547.1 calcium-binding protein [Sulfuricurvum sp.]
MYTITVKIAANGTIYHEDGTSTTGHMWYSLSNGSSTESYGFAPAKDGMPLWEGTIKTTDDANYGSTYYTGTIVINQWQYEQLIAFGNKNNLDGNQFDFSSYYNGLTNSCIDYTWKALSLIGMNPSDFEGQLWPTHNADNADVALYKYLFGSTSGWNEAWPDGGDYHVIYGSNGNDTLTAALNTDAIYGGGGTDTLIGSALNDFLDGGAGVDEMYGGAGYDTYIAGLGDKVYDSDGSGAIYLGGEHLDGGDKKVIKHIGVTTTNYTKTFTYCECKTVTKWSDVSTDEWKEEEAFYIDKATGTKYILSGSTLSIISASGTITINNFSNGQLGIHLGESEKIDKSDVTRDVFLEEDFCSPLVLDINNNGNSSTRLGNSNVYFDMDGDGFKERTAWVEQGDGLLVLDRVISNILPQQRMNNVLKMTDETYLREIAV